MLSGRAAHTHTHTHTFFKTFLDTLPAPSKTDRMPCWKRCRAACCAESGGKKMLMLKASGSSGHLLYCDGQDEQVTLKLQKSHQTQGQCRISWDRKQSLLVDPIRAPTRDNATRMAGLVPENSGHSIPMHPSLPATRKTIVKRRRPHCRSWDAHDMVASYVGKEAGPSRIGCAIRYVPYVFHVTSQ